MVDLLRDIEIMENVLVAMAEGASDEKRMALASLERLVCEKQQIVREFEKQAPGYQFEMDELFDNIPL